jgi:hypothetical protein
VQRAFDLPAAAPRPAPVYSRPGIGYQPPELTPEPPRTTGAASPLRPALSDHPTTARPARLISTRCEPALNLLSLNPMRVSQANLF